MKATLRLNPSRKLGIKGMEGDEIEVDEEMAIILRRQGVIYTEAQEAELKTQKKEAALKGEQPQQTVTSQRQELRVDEKGKK